MEIRRNCEEAAFDSRLPAPYQIVPRRRRLGVTERVDYAGQVVKLLAEAEVREAVQRLAEMQVEALAVCYLFAFLNPVHGLRARELIREVLPGIHISLSSEVLPQVREVERLSITLARPMSPPAYGYLERLDMEFRQRGFQGDLFIMQGNGGVVGLAQAQTHGVQALHVRTGQRRGGQRLYRARPPVPKMSSPSIWGGTSFDVCLVQDGRPQTGTERWMRRYRIAALPTMPMRAPKLEGRTAPQRSGPTQRCGGPEYQGVQFIGHPALNLSCGLRAGLAVGLQLVGRQWQESTLLRVAYVFEQGVDWEQSWSCAQDRMGEL